MSISELRSSAVCETVDRIKETIHEAEIADLNRAKDLLVGLAKKRELFPPTELPRATETQRDRIFCLYKEDDGKFAMYVNVVYPGVTSLPHDHGNSWAIVAAIEGQEKHRFFQRVDDGRTPGHAELDRSAEIIIEPGTAVSMQIGGIHSIEAVGSKPSMLLHFYGWAFEKQTDRIEFQVSTNTYKPTVDAASGVEDLMPRADVTT